SITDSVVTWEDKDGGYITSQFYTVAMADDTSNTLVGGGTQDNGSPFISLNDNFEQDGTSVDASSGDGSYAQFTDSLLFVSSQNGRVIRYDLDDTGTYNFASFVQPSEAQNQLFIHPYMADPNNEAIMYYPDVGPEGTPRMWVNTEIDEVSNQNGAGVTQGWNAVDLGVESGYVISTLEVSRRPGDILYYAASSDSEIPKIFKATDASGAFNTTDISIAAAASGAYVHDIALNPVDADEAVVVMSNYGITGIYHTADGGQNWTAVEGNLSSDKSGNAGEGPSIRSATIMPTGNSTIYVVGTSVGLYSTETLDGGNTTWMQESAGDGTGPNRSFIGNSVVEFVISRITDGDVAVGTHGRGIFIGDFTGQFSSPGPPSAPTDLVADAKDGSVDLSWSKSPEVDVTSYKIYRGSQPDNLTFVAEVPSTQTTYSEQTTGFQSDYYAVSAVDNDGNESPRNRPVAAFRKSRTVDTSWRLVGSPVLTPAGAQLPEGLTLFGFDGVYEIAEQMEEGRGYWVKHTETDTIRYLGSGATSRTVALRAGWNLVSGVADTIPAGKIQDPDGVLSATPPKMYDGTSYIDATSLLPTRGYFIHAAQDGKIILQADTSSTAAKANKLAAGAGPGNEEFEPVSGDQLDRIFFSRNGVTQTLLVSRSGLSARQKQFYRTPPAPPEPTIDVRTSTGFRLADNNETELTVTASAYPIKVQLSGDAGAESYRLLGINEGEKIYFDLLPGKTVSVEQPFDKLMLAGLEGSELPLSNELLPNYPNPFNPSTTIQYRLASKAQVNLEVYNLIGRRVRTLVNKVQNPGSYRVTFDGSGLSSGTYFVRIQAGDFSRVQKMTLIK
ncbi:MAG: T9SS type A sorting domain-containing protein, partial [Balneolaceae bacterium]|nr:T9SS type A sorting domain-containing protein [Balneolaceae bacterium]